MPDSHDVTSSAVRAAGGLLTHACHDPARDRGWWTDLDTGEDLCGWSPAKKPRRNVPEMLCLIHSEISEAMEGYRKNAMDEHLPRRTALEVELADAVVRIFDMAGGLELDLAGAIAEKLAYNASRVDHSLAARRAVGGKRF